MGGKMKFSYKLGLFLFSFACMTFFSHIAGAQSADDLRKEIFPQLRDRRCSTMSLDKCNCPDAREMKAYIDALIESGIGKDEIFYKVAKKFSLITILDSQIKALVEKRLTGEIGDKRPQLSPEIPAFDFGKVSKKQGQLKKNIKIFNKGNSDLVIKNLKVSCSCVTVALRVDKNRSPYFASAGSQEGWQMSIEPGKSGELEITLDLTNPAIKSGKVIREIFITSNDPLYPESSVRLEAEVLG